MKSFKSLLILFWLLSLVVEGIDVVADDDDIRLFHVTMTGPAGTPYEGGQYKL